MLSENQNKENITQESSSFTKDNLEFYLRELAKEYRKLAGRQMPAEIVLIGGAAIVSNYGFRDMTTDIDAVIHAGSAMKEAINRIADRYHLANGWLNADFQNTSSYSPRIVEFSSYLYTRSNVLEIRTIRSEYLVAMKLVSGRRYKRDLSDIIGVLYEQKEKGDPVDFNKIDQAMINLYGSWNRVDSYMRDFLQKVLSTDNLKELYLESMKEEDATKETVLEIDQNYPRLISEDNIDSIIAQAEKKIQERKAEIK